MATSGLTYRRCDLCQVSKHKSETLYLRPGSLRASSARICLKCIEAIYDHLKLSTSDHAVITAVKRSA